MQSLNVGNLDRLMRIVVGVVLLALTTSGVIGPWGYLGLVPLLTGIVAFCPLYAALGIRTTSR
ncbi:MAG: DUF2892 domain-containing protein [Caldimonas sp.]